MSDDTTIDPTATVDPAPTAQRVEDLPDWAQKALTDARRDAASSRVNAKQAAADEARNELAQSIGKALGLVKDEPVDPAQLTEQLTATQQAAAEARRELAIYRAAPDQATAQALLDSRAFIKATETIDPTDTDALAAAVQQAITANPLLTRQAPQAAAVGGADTVGGTGTVRTFTRSQIGDPAFFQANRAEILAAMRDERIRD